MAPDGTLPEVRLGVLADTHLALERLEPASWHNPYRLADAHTRLERALAHPFIQDADVVVVLGDLAHFGDRTSIRFVVDAVEAVGKPAVLLSGNHDVLEDGVRLEQEVEAASTTNVWAPCGPPPHADLVDVFDTAAFDLTVHEVLAETGRPVEPFDVAEVSVRRAEGAAATVLLTHFPVLSLEERCREAAMLYAGHLEQLAPAPPPAAGAPARPIVALSGHLHLRGVTTHDSTLQLVFAALVEAPYEVASVEIQRGDGSAVTVSYECDPVHPLDVEHLPVLDPAGGTWTWTGDRWTL